MSRLGWPLAVVLAWASVYAAANFIPGGGVQIASGVAIGWKLLFGIAAGVSCCWLLKLLFGNTSFAGAVLGSWIVTIFYLSSGAPFDGSLGCSLGFTGCWLIQKLFPSKQKSG